MKPKNVLKTTTPLAIPGSYRHAVPGAKLLKKSDPGARIKVSIYARQNPTEPGKSPAPLEELNKQLPAERHYLKGEEFDSTFGANPADLEKIAAWAEASKLKVLDSSVPKRRVLVEGTIRDISKAFGVQLNEYDHPDEGRFRGREGEVHVPPDLYGIVQGVFGLDTRPIGEPRLRRPNVQPVDVRNLAAAKRNTARKKGANPAAAVANPFPGTFFPTDVAELYNYPSSLSGKNQNVAVFTFNGATPSKSGGYSLDALENYFDQVIGQKTPSIQDVVVQGPGNDPGPDTKASGRRGDVTGEVMLDMCVVGSVAPDANLFVYFTEFTSQGWLDALHQAITDKNDISVISISYGNPEDDPSGAWTAMGVQLVNEAFQAAVAKGITICCSSGDDGSSDQVPTGAHVDFPASSPFVLGVGGTKLVATNGSISEETVWNETMQNHGATGGGISAVFTKPDYQNSVTVPPSANPGHKIGRGVPDVAAVADPLTGVVVMHIDGKHIEPIGGTSASAPLWAALVARLNEGLQARCGFLNPLLYGRFAKGVLRDIAVGNNGAYQAETGWDACTGLGSPGEALFQALSGESVSHHEQPSEVQVARGRG